ncbi:MAG: short-chain fatty acyl-CoA regulator family protein [Pseudomonadota bacterium]
MARKIMLGHKVRRLRRDRDMTQTAMAERLGISPSYLNLIESNQRPVTVDLLLRIGQEFDVDVGRFAEDEGARLLSGLQEVFADPLLAKADVKRQDLMELSERVPTAAKAMISLFHAYRDLVRDAHLMRAAETPALSDGPEVAAGQGTSFVMDEIGDYLHDHGNYFEPLEAAAEAVWHEGGIEPGNLYQGLVGYLDRELALRVKIVPSDVMTGLQRRYDRHGRRILLSEMLPPSTRAFQLALQLALIKYRSLLDGMVRDARLVSDDAKPLVRIALANYLAGALTMPYERFWRAATAERYDIQVLGQRFDASFEQVCHRLTTLQRPGAKGVPFFMIRVDTAGNVSKRFSAKGAAVAQFGGACPRWNVHDAFRAPGLHIQVSEMPDGERYFSVARAIAKPGVGFHNPGQRLAIALGCEIAHAAQLVYADGVDLLNEDIAVPIGPHCRICERIDCNQRAFPPITHRLVVDDNQRGMAAYGLAPRVPEGDAA